MRLKTLEALVSYIKSVGALSQLQTFDCYTDYCLFVGACRSSEADGL